MRRFVRPFQIGVIAVAIAIAVNLATSEDVSTAKLLVLGALLVLLVLAQTLLSPDADVTTDAAPVPAHAAIAASVRLWTAGGPPRVVDVTPGQAGAADVRGPSPTLFRRSRRYLDRDLDQELERALRTEDFVLLVGGAASGKTRTALEACRRVHPDRALIVPTSREGLAAVLQALHREELTRNSIVWLDDLELYLGAGGLTAARLDDLRRLHPPVIVVATMRASEWDAAMSEREDGSVANLLRKARLLTLDAQLSSAELRACEDVFAEEGPRFLREVTTYGLGPYLVAAPDLINRLQIGKVAHKAGYAVVRAASDWRRAGLAWPIPATRLERLFTIYGSPDSFEAGLEWALTSVADNGSVLTRSGTDAFAAPDFIVDSIHEEFPHVPASTFGALLDEASPAESLIVAKQAFHLAERGTADAEIERGLEQARSVDPGEALSGLAILAMRRSADTDEIERLWRMAAEHGSAFGAGGLAHLLLTTGREKEAEPHLRVAAERGDLNGMANLAQLLSKRGEFAEAERWLWKVAEDDEPRAKFGLALIEDAQGHVAMAREYASRAVQLGHAEASGLLGMLADNAGDEAEAEYWYRRGAEAGDPIAQGMLGGLLRHKKQPKEAKRWLRSAAEAGVADAAHLLGDALAEEGRPDAAAKWWRQAAEAGEEAAAEHLGHYLVQRGRHADGETWLRRSARAGNAEAAHSLAMLLHDQGRDSESERWLRRAARKGSSIAMCRLGDRLFADGKLDEARHWLEAAVEAGHAHAGFMLAKLMLEALEEPEAVKVMQRCARDGDPSCCALYAAYLTDHGRNAEAEKWARIAMENDAPAANHLLGDILVTRGALLPRWRNSRLREAEQLLLAAANDGNLDAAESLGNLYEDLRRYEEARKWWTVAAREESASAAFMLGMHLVRHGREVDGEEWIRRAADRGHAKAARRLVDILDSSGRARTADPYRERLLVR